jgi:hypothetical protein
MTGEVKCRVYNDYGAEFSTVARITVISKCVEVIYKQMCPSDAYITPNEKLVKSFLTEISEVKVLCIF